MMKSLKTYKTKDKGRKQKGDVKEKPMEANDMEEVNGMEEVNDMEDDDTDDDTTVEDDEFDYEIEDDQILEDVDIKATNKIREENERKQYADLKKNGDNDVYPLLDDPNFSRKISQKIEFNNTQYDGKILDIKKEAEKWCHRGFNILPHQHFVKNFVSKQTPYNSLILYFGLGSGKTCAAIGIAELARQYMRLNSFENPIMIIAKPGIQANFRKELFDDNKLHKINAKGEKVGDNTRNSVWNIENCVGNSLLSEINPNTIMTMKRADINEYINRIIKRYYVFYGYDKLRNYIVNNVYRKLKTVGTDEEKKQLEIHLIQQLFNNRLMIIDEVHNIRLSDANNKNEGSKTSDMLSKIVKYTENMKLLLLSATPMYNKVEEIIWLCNLVNLNDGRSLVKISDVFEPITGEFVKSSGKNKESGDELLRRKLIGYVSYIRGENPYLFPYRLYPATFTTDVSKTLKGIKYPDRMITGKELAKKDRIKYVDVYVNGCGSYQRRGYKVSTTPLANNKEVGQTYSYKFIQKPLQCLNIVYPTEELDNYNERSKGVSVNVDNIVGDNGLKNVMRYKKVPIISNGAVSTSVSGNNEAKKDFEYLPNAEHIFKMENLGKYSEKMFNICQIIGGSSGIIMIYSQYLESGIIPMALALEELGFVRFGYHNLFKTAPALPNGMSYTIISGIAGYSPEKLLPETMRTINGEPNKNGEKIKVVLITKAAAEGLDFANIRQVHIMDSWFNMSRIEQIIGRAVRTKSHCLLPFEKRCVEIYMHTTYEPGEPEFMDMYLYRIAEKKAIRMGEVSRILKEVSVDCLLNVEQTNFTVDKLLKVVENQHIKLELSSIPNKMVDFKIGDKPYSSLCDYMEDCEFKCSAASGTIIPTTTNGKKGQLNLATYSVDNLKTNYQKIAKRVKELFREENKYFYKKRDLVNLIQIQEEYEIEEIYYVLRRFVDQKETLIDEYGNSRHLIQKGEYYLANHVELENTVDLTTYDITHPIQYKPEKFTMRLGKDIDTVATDATDDTDNKKGDDGGDAVAIVREIGRNVAIALGGSGSSDAPWYKQVSQCLTALRAIVPDITDDDVRKYVVAHNIETMTFDEHMALIEAIYNTSHPLTNFEEVLKTTGLKGDVVGYFNSIRIKYETKEYMLLVSPEKSKTRWTMVSLDEDDFLENVKAVVTERILKKVSPPPKNKFFLLKKGGVVVKDIGDIHREITFISSGIFKKKDLGNPRAINSNGATMTNVENGEIRQQIRDYVKLVGGSPQTNFGGYRDFPKTILCALVEMLARYLTDKNVGDRVYYIKPVENVYTMSNSVFEPERKR